MLHGYLVPHPPLIVPGIGSGDEIPATRQAYETIAAELAGQHPATLVMISPHSIQYQDYFHIAPGEKASGDFGSFHAADVRFSVTYDRELAGRIETLADEEGIPAGPLGEQHPQLDHGIMVPLYFMPPAKIVRVSLSGLSLTDHYRFGMCIGKAVRSMPYAAAIIASGDMSHVLKEDGPYGFVPEGPQFDALVQACIADGDVRKLMAIDRRLSEGAAECGLRSLVMLLGALDGLQTESRVLSYEGPFGVGYLTAAFTGGVSAPSLLPGILEDKQTQINGQRSREDPLVRLARENAEHYIQTGRYIRLPDNLPAEITDRRAGVFVSIKKDGQLRGCIGTISPAQETIAQEILNNSVSAACGDPRFNPVTPDELNQLTYSVDVLSAAESIAGPQELDPARYGVIVSAGHKRGLLLPNLEGVDTVEDQINIARQKAGIGPGEPYTLERFEVVRHT